jgi:hypothetical protein
MAPVWVLSSYWRGTPMAGYRRAESAEEVWCYAPRLIVPLQSEGELLPSARERWRIKNPHHAAGALDSEPPA